MALEGAIRCQQVDSISDDDMPLAEAAQATQKHPRRVEEEIDGPDAMLPDRQPAAMGGCSQHTAGPPEGAGGQVQPEGAAGTGGATSFQEAAPLEQT
eukprot:4770041-Pyramimonas_sp.AAC.1